MTIPMETPVDSSFIGHESSLSEGTGGYIVQEQGTMRRILARVVDFATRKSPDESIAYFRAEMFIMAVRGGSGQAWVTLLTEKPKSKPPSGTDSASLATDLPALTKKGDPLVFAAGIPKNTEALHLNLDSRSDETVILGLATGKPGPETPEDLAGSPQSMSDYAAKDSSRDSPVKIDDDTDFIRVTSHPHRSEQELLDMLAKDLELYPTLEKGWDGYSAEPLNPESLADARTFLDHWSPGVKVPFAELVPNGAVGLYWEQGEVFVSTVFGGEGKFSYYASFRDDSGKVTKLYDEDCEANALWPDDLLRVVRKLG